MSSYALVMVQPHRIVIEPLFINGVVDVWFAESAILGGRILHTHGLVEQVSRPQIARWLFDEQAHSTMKKS